MTLEEKLAGYPHPRRTPNTRRAVRDELEEAGAKVVVLDDDPTGTQTVHDLPVYTNWSAEVLTEALRSPDRVFYLSTNSRSLTAEDAAALGREIGAGLVAGAKAAGLAKDGIIAASRSDSTLRGHYPAEVDALFAGMERTPDGVIIAPAFFEGGRYTIDDVHWVEQEGELVPAHETEFARDPDFGYGTSDLKRWVEEKTKGVVRASSVLSIGLDTIRTEGPDGVAAILRRAEGGVPVVLNAACYDDLETAVAGLLAAERDGKTFAYRCAASFVKIRAGVEDRALLRRSDMTSTPGPGLVVMGSYVEKSTRQLRALLGEPEMRGVELDVSRLLETDAAAEVQRAVRAVDEGLSSGNDVTIYTSRKRNASGPGEFLDAGRRIMRGLCDVVRSLTGSPAWVIAKGGITSIEVARTALSVQKARVLGQIIHGVPVWRLGPDARWPNLPYVVYPGNVGDDRALRTAYRVLTGKEEDDD